MSDVIITPLMGLANPVPGVDPGPDYATNISNSFNIIDGHNHSAGSGNQINTSGILINADLPFNSSYNATQLRSIRFTAQASPLALAADLGCLYESGVDLYYNDGNGNQVRITSGGTVNATSSGISSGTASAAFSGGVLVVNSNTNTPANVQCGSVLIGNTTVSPNFVTISAPNALAASYALSLPAALPGASSYLTIGNTGSVATRTITSPTVQRFISGSGTYTLPANCLYIKVTMVGGGGGGGATGSSSLGGTNGGDTTFGTTLLSAGGGLTGFLGAPGGGGSASLGSGPIGVAIPGTPGQGVITFLQTTRGFSGSGGGSAPFFNGAGSGGAVGGIAGPAVTNSGSGGGSPAQSNSVNSFLSGGGGSGGGVMAYIRSPSATYAYVVGAGGTGGTGAIDNGAAGAAGQIIVEEFYS